MRFKPAPIDCDELTALLDEIERLREREETLLADAGLNYAEGRKDGLDEGYREIAELERENAALKVENEILRAESDRLLVQIGLVADMTIDSQTRTEIRRLIRERLPREHFIAKFDDDKKGGEQ